MDILTLTERRSNLEKLQGRLIRQLAETHCQVEALYGYSKRDLAVIQLDAHGKLQQDRITDLQLQAELASSCLSALMRLNLAVQYAVDELRAAEASEVPVYPLAIIPQGIG